MLGTQKIKRIELEHKKLIAESNALLLALASVTLGTAAFIYTLTSNSILSLIGLALVLFIINSEKENKSKEIENKVNEL